jgi:hypothetical protein
MKKREKLKGRVGRARHASDSKAMLHEWETHVSIRVSDEYCALCVGYHLAMEVRAAIYDSGYGLGVRDLHFKAMSRESAEAIANRAKDFLQSHGAKATIAIGLWCEETEVIATL